MVRDFGAREMRPKIMEWDESQYFPIELFRKMGELGLMGVLVPEEYGGSGFGYHEYATAIAELSKIDGSIGLSMAAHNSSTLHRSHTSVLPVKNKSKESICQGLQQVNGSVHGD